MCWAASAVTVTDRADTKTVTKKGIRSIHNFSFITNWLPLKLKGAFLLLHSPKQQRFTFPSLTHPSHISTTPKASLIQLNTAQTLFIFPPFLPVLPLFARRFAPHHAFVIVASSTVGARRRRRRPPASTGRAAAAAAVAAASVGCSRKEIHVLRTVVELETGSCGL